MKCTSDPAKHVKPLAERGLDLETDGAEILAGATLTFEDDRFDYGGETAHVISIRKANDREPKAYAPRF